MSKRNNGEYKKLPGIEYMPYYSRVDSMECGFGINWYVCHHCHETFIYDYGKAQRHDPNFCPICGDPNEPVLMQDEETNNE